jgi:hypothetical protein
MNQREPSSARIGIREVPTLLATFLIPIALVLHHWNPCDSTASVAAGDSLMHIGLVLVIAFLTALGRVLPSPRARGENSPSEFRASAGFWMGAGLFCVWLALATWWTIGRGNARFAVNGFWQWTSLVVLSATIVSLALQRGFSRACLVLLVGIAMGVVVYGYWEYGVIQPALRAQLQSNPDSLFRNEGIPMDSSAGLLMADRIRSTEMRSVYALANSLGGFLACTWVVLLGLLARVWEDRQPETGWALRVRWSLLAVIAACSLVFIALLLTKSRTAWLAAAAGTVGLWFVHPAAGWQWVVRHRVVSIFGLGVIACTIGVVYAVDPLILLEAGKSMSYRLDYWRGAMALIAQSPVLGYGCANFQSTYLRVKLPTAAESPADPHNMVLEIAHAGGLVLLVIALGCGIAWWFSWRRIRLRDTTTSPIQEFRTRSEIALWSGAVVACAGLMSWCFFTVGDNQLIGALFAVLAAIATAMVLSRSAPLKASVHHLVQRDTGPCAVGVGVWMIHFLASGGWMLPGTMATVMVLIGLSLQVPIGADPIACGRWNPRWRYAGLAGVSVLLLGWYVSMMVPVTHALGSLMATLGSRTSPSLSELRALPDADALDPELPRLGLERCVEQLERSLAESTRREWESLLQELRVLFLKRDPGHALALTACGQAALRVAAATPLGDQRREWLMQADGDLQRASEAFPASVEAHVQAALVSYWVGDPDRAMRHCEAAESIDAATPHRDRKIQAATILWPRPLESVTSGLPVDSRRGIPKDFVRAEPVLVYLRSVCRP